MKNILIPTDFSECALNALKVAADIARKSNAVMHLVHAYEKPVSGVSLQFEIDKAELKKIHAQLENELKDLGNKDFLEGLTVKKHLVSDTPIWEIPEMDTYKEMDLIIMGSNGAKGIRELFLGSNAQKMVRMSEIPVLVIKDYADPSNIKNIVFASNFYTESETEFSKIKSIAELLEAKVHLLKVITPNEFENTDYSKKLMQEFAADTKLENYTINTYNDKKVEHGIYAFSKEVGADMIAMETHGRTGLGRAVLGSLVEHVVNHSEMPVLSSRIEEPDYDYGVIFPDNR